VGSPSKIETMSYLKTLLRSEAFARRDRQKSLLNYLVQAASENVQRSELKETVIGHEVFGRKADYDPKKDAIVRVSVGELRQKLERYYQTEGRDDAIRIRIPKGSYLPAIDVETTDPILKLTDRAAMHVANARTALDQRTLPSLQAALSYLDSALLDHPRHPALLSLKAMVHTVRAGYGALPSVEILEAESLIEKAKQSGYEAWELCVAEAEVRMALYFDWSGADRLFARSLELSHGESQYNLFYGAFVASQLRFQEYFEIKRDALAHFAHDSVFARCDLSIAQMFLRKYDDAEETIREILTLFPADRYMSYLHLAVLREARGEFQEALLVLEEMPVSIAESTISAGLRGLIAGRAGDGKKARDIYHRLLSYRNSGQHFVPGTQLAIAAIGIEDYDAATGWFREAAIVERDPIMNWAAILPFQRHIHHHVEFRNLVTDTMRLKFPK
jgi:tetratricopeptide (TPR) repeat protein